MQDDLASSGIFSILDLQYEYCSPRRPSKDGFFCSGPGMGLYQFTRMPFGLAGTPCSFHTCVGQVFPGAGVAPDQEKV